MQTGTNIWGGVFDSRHSVTTELGSRSRGFVWFFSFLAWYSDVKRDQRPVILLLDEPGLILHAKAQEDLLRYFEIELKAAHQLV
jgi:predicted ATP-dependent endonuclease of OLD family